MTGRHEEATSCRLQHHIRLPRTSPDPPQHRPPASRAYAARGTVIPAVSQDSLPCTCRGRQPSKSANRADRRRCARLAGLAARPGDRLANDPCRADLDAL